MTNTHGYNDKCFSSSRQTETRQSNTDWKCIKGIQIQFRQYKNINAWTESKLYNLELGWACFFLKLGHDIMAAKNSFNTNTPRLLFRITWHLYSYFSGAVETEGGSSLNHGLFKTQAHRKLAGARLLDSWQIFSKSWAMTTASLGRRTEGQKENKNEDGERTLILRMIMPASQTWGMCP